MWPFKTNSWTNPLPDYAQAPEKRAFLDTVLHKICAIPNADWKGKNNGEPYDFYSENYDSDLGRQERRLEYKFYETTTQGGVVVKICYISRNSYGASEYSLLLDETRTIDMKGSSSWSKPVGHEGLSVLWDRIHKEREPLRMQKYEEEQREKRDEKSCVRRMMRKREAIS